jgi:hypothetical protein
MGWLFAVARGLQEKSRRAVLGSLLPIAIGHEASIVTVVVAVSLTEQVVPPFFVRMLAPVLLGLPVYATYHSLSEISLQAVAAASLHVTAMLIVMGIVSVVVYKKVGLDILRRGWFNLDLGWSFVLIASGAVTLFTAV